MARYGNHFHIATPRMVSVPPGILEFWTTVWSIPASQMGTMPGSVVLVVMGKAGDFEQTGTSPLPQGAVEVGITTGDPSLGPSTNHRHVYCLGDPLMQYTPGPQGGHRGSTWQWVIHLPSLTSTDTVRLVGKIRRNGASVADTGGVARLEKLKILAWNLDDLTTSRYVRGEVKSIGGAGSALPLSTSPQTNWNLVLSSAAIPWSSGTERWLVFHSAQVEPFGVGPYATWPAAVDTDWSTILSEFGKDRQGSRARIATGPDKASYSYGAFHVLDVSQADVKVGIRGRCLYSSGQQAIRQQLDILAVRADDLDGFVVDDTPSHTYFGATGTQSPLEIAATVDVDENVVVISRAVPRNNLGGGRRSFGHLLGLYDGQVESRTGHYVVQDELQDGVPDFNALPGLVQVGELVIDWEGEQNPNDPNQGTAWDAADLVICAFGFTDDGEPTITPKTPGPEVVVIPSKESLGLGSLQALPVEPSSSVQWDWIDEQASLQTHKGYRITWPLMLTPVRRGVLPWRDLTQAQLDTLQDFFDGLSEQAFKWTPPGGSEMALVATSGLLVARDADGFLSASLEVLELEYIG